MSAEMITGYSDEEQIRQIFHQCNKSEGDLGDFNFTIGGQDDTIYKGNKDQAEDWENAYLPNSVELEVLGVVENLPFPTECGELVIMLCEDHQLYAYDGEDMHLVAKSLMDLFDSELQYPGIKSYYYGERFKKNMSSKEWKELKPEHHEDKEHRALIKSREKEFLELISKLDLLDPRQNKSLNMSSPDSNTSGSSMDLKAPADIKHMNATYQPTRKNNSQKRQSSPSDSPRSSRRIKQEKIQIKNLIEIR
ncbi:hypothetical protein DPEC_G00286520 [Dallia pectoralis]|uniref:Uncharacterized protein n=1 Tax=Dallia pectoralis TaxID=75939 RepID=A0ACC2FK30_DALPE|nr:hypothetical protein DPEC_G00286520 [Dallia pectoralis]